MAAPIRASGATFESGAPTRLFPIPPIQGIVNRDEYVVAADGNRILTSVLAGDPSAAMLTVVSNWQGSIQK
jgi:hypothetical protein